MLVLTRRKGQQITIGPDIRITVISSECGNVKIGVDAPRELQILRLPEHADRFDAALAEAKDR